MPEIATVEIEWDRACRKPVALVILLWSQGGWTIAHKDASGKHYGCRDVSNSDRSAAAVCLAAWINDAKRRGLTIEDCGDARGAIKAVAGDFLEAVAN